MKAATRKRLYNWHSITGLTTTVLLTALCLTALPATFIEDIYNWLTPKSTLSNTLTHTEELDEWLDLADQKLDLAGKEFHIRPGEKGFNLWAPHGEGFAAFVLNDNGQFIQHHASAASKVLAEVHHNFLLPDPYGEYLVGLLGLAMLALVFMGVLLHKKWKKEKTQLRKTRSRRLFLSDIHKVLGLWLLPFHIFVSYTGATLGLGSLLLVVAAVSAFNGDQDAAVAAVLGKEPTLSENVCQMRSPKELTQLANAHWQEKYGESHIIDIEIHGWKDCNSQVTIASAIPGYLLSSNALTYSLTSGDLIKEIDWIPSGFGERWYALLGPLHFGTYAGYLSQWLFFVSAILLAVMMVSGMLLWLNKNNQTMEKSLFIKSLTATCMGISFASAILLCVTLVQNFATTGTQYDAQFYKALYGFSFLIIATLCLSYLPIWKLISYMTAMLMLGSTLIHITFFNGLITDLTINLVFLMMSFFFFALPHLKALKLENYLEVPKDSASTGQL